MIIDECGYLSLEAVYEQVGHLPRSERGPQQRRAARERQACKVRGWTMSTSGNRESAMSHLDSARHAPVCLPRGRGSRAMPFRSDGRTH